MHWRNSYRWPRGAQRAFWREMRNLQDEMEFILGGTYGPLASRYPAVNAWLNDEAIFVTAEMPGVDPDSLDITIVDQTLTISGTIGDGQDLEEADFYRRERKTGEFSRTLNLPFNVDADSVVAKIENGILKLELPRLPEEKPRKIEIKTA